MVGRTPYIALIVILIFSNLLFGMACVQDCDENCGDPDPGNGNGTVDPLVPVRDNLTVLEAYHLIQNNTNNSRFVIMDVRSSSDYRAGHIPGAMNLDYYNGELSKYIRFFDRNFTYLVYCDGSLLTTLVLNEMEAMRFMEIYSMLNGIERWKELGYDIEEGEP